MPPARLFEPEGTYGEIPYKVNEAGSIDAILEGKVVRFLDVDDFLAAATTRAHGGVRSMERERFSMRAA